MKTILLEGVGEVTLRKSRLAKRIILKVSQAGKPVVTVPNYVPYMVAETFARQHSQWFVQHLPKQVAATFFNGKSVGRTHVLRFKPQAAKAITSRVSSNVITVTYPNHYQIESAPVQAEASKASIRALRREAEAFLPSNLHKLAQQHGYKYKEVRVKAVETRWGSCSSSKIINLSIWLMQIPDELIEYVLCHELTHLNHMNHSLQFWQELSTMVPDYKAKRTALKNYMPRLI